MQRSSCCVLCSTEALGVNIVIFSYSLILARQCLVPRFLHAPAPVFAAGSPSPVAEARGSWTHPLRSVDCLYFHIGDVVFIQTVVRSVARNLHN